MADWYPVDVRLAPPPRSSRPLAALTLIGLKPLVLLPHLLVLTVLVPLQWLVFVLAQVAVLFRARYPMQLSLFVAGVERWRLRVLAYAMGLTDVYPPFTLAPGDHPVQLLVARVPRSSRLWAFNLLTSLVTIGWIFGVWLLPSVNIRTLAVLPHLVPMVGLWVAAAAVSVAAQTVVVVTGRYPLTLHRFAVGVLRWSMRLSCFSLGLTDRYPPFRLRSLPPGAGVVTGGHVSRSAMTADWPPPAWPPADWPPPSWPPDHGAGGDAPPLQNTGP